jgi:hypothetical protein
MLISSSRYKPYVQKIKIPVDRSTWCRMYEIKRERRDREKDRKNHNSFIATAVNIKTIKVIV